MTPIPAGSTALKDRMDGAGADRRARLRWTWAAALLASIPAALLPIGAYPLVDPDEGRYGAIPAAMVTTGDWVVPRLNGVPYAEKPPATYWAVALSISAFGRSEMAVRLPAAVFTCLTALWIGWVAARSWGGAAGAIASIVYLATPLVLVLGRAPLPDVPLTLGLAISIGAFFLDAGDATLRLPGLWFWGGLALAFLSKGPIALVLVGGTLACSGLGVLRRSRCLGSVPGALLFLLLVAPWFLTMSLRLPGFAQFYFWQEHVDRFLGAGGRRHHGLGPLGFLLSSLGVAMPWLLLTLPGGASERAAAEAGRQVRILAAWSLFPLVFFLLSRSRLLSYVLPCIPGLAILAGRRIWLSAGARCARPHRLAGNVTTLLGVCSIGLAASSTVSWSGIPWLPPRALELQAALGSLVWCLPAVAGAGLIVSGWWIRRSPIAGSICLGAVLCATAAMGAMAAGSIGSTYSTREVVSFLGALPPAEVVNVGHLRPSLEFHLGHPVPQYGPTGELEFGSRFDDGRLILRDPEALGRRLEVNGVLYLVCDDKWKEILESRLDHALERIGGRGNNQLFRLEWKARR